MSRRKQARPRLVKREDEEEEAGDLKDDIEDEPELKIARGSSPTGDTDPNGLAERSNKKNDPSSTAVKDPETFTCETCGATFDNLGHFMDHRNFECDSDSHWNTENGSRSDTPSSMDSCELYKLGSPHRDSSPSQSLFNTDPDQVPFNVGVNNAHPYGCQFCDKAFARLRHLKVHEQVHADMMPFSCGFCKRLFRHKRSRDRHVKLHTGDRKYKCSLCDFAFARSDHLKSHLKTHETCKSFQCEICFQSYASMSTLMSHMASSHKDSIATSRRASNQQEDEEEEELRCLHCKEMFPNANELDVHAENCLYFPNKKISLQCSICSVICAGKAELDLHIEQKHGTEPESLKNKCPVCLKVLPSLEELSFHVKMHGLSGLPQDGQSASTSELSSFEFTKSILAGATNGKFSGDFLVCPYCLRDDFETLEGLEIHMQSVHSVKPTEVYTCNYCNAPYKNLYSLHEHMRAVHQNQPSMGIKYPCSRCSKEFPSIETLSEHRKKHHSSSKNKMPVVECVFCVQCSMSFSSTVALQEHIITSHKEIQSRTDDSKRTPLKSPKFSKSNFTETRPTSRHSTESNSSNVVVGPIINVPEPPISFLHMTRPASVGCDLGQEKLTCDQCNAVFPDSSSFQAHVKLHRESMVGQFPCKKCCKAFPNEELLECHLSSHYLATMTEYGCTSCLKLFNKPDELQKHLMDIHAHHLYRCSLCREIFDSKVNIQVHFAIKHSNECKLYKCVQCDAIFRSETEWQVHVRVSHLNMTKPYRCLFCKESFTTEMDLQCHLATHNKPFKCSMCDESFLVEFLLDKHLQSVHASGVSGTRPASVTGDAGLDGSLGPVEVKLEQDIDPVKSDLFTTGSLSLYPSMSSATGSLVWRNSEDLYRCNICDQKFSQLSNLHNHKLEDHGVKVSPFQSPYSPSSSPQGSTSGERAGEVTPVSSRSQSASALLTSTAHSNTLPSTVVTTSPSLSVTMTTTSSSTSVLAEALKSTMSLPLSIPEPPAGYSDKLALAFGEKLNLSCTFCSQTFKCKTDLEKHSKIHLNTGSQKCNICDEVFSSTGVLAEHKLQHCKIQQGNICVMCKVQLRSEDQFYNHSQEHGFQGAVMQCIVCRQTLASMIELQMHGKHHFQTKPTFYTCCVCSKSFETNENLISKLNSNGRTYYVCKPCYHGEGSQYSCTQCGYSFSSSSQLEAHMTTHKQMFQCIKCQESFSSEYEIQLHVASHVMKEGNSHECKLCFTILDSPARLQCHLIEHTYKNSEFRCSMCCKTFNNSTEIQSHALEHGLSARRYGCTLCNQKFFFSAELDNHMFVHTNQTAQFSPSAAKQPNSDFKCTECDKSFPSLSSLLNHYPVHDSKDSLKKCPHCSQMFTNAGALQSHVISTHSAGGSSTLGTEIFQCLECDKVFASRSSLQGHTQVHRSGNRVTCLVCKKTFSSSKNLTLHMRSHNTSRPYECPVCKKCFTRKENRTIHMKMHANSKPFLCPVCGKCFSKKANVQEHMKSHYVKTGVGVEQTTSDVDVNSDNTSGSSDDIQTITLQLSEPELSDPDEDETPQEVTSTSNIPDEEVNKH